MLPQTYLNHLFHHCATPYSFNPLERAARRIAAAYQIDRLFQKVESIYMPRKASKNKSTDWQVTFSTCKLSASDKKAFETWAKDQGDDFFLVAYPDLLQSGIKCSMSYDADNDCFIFSMTDRNPSSANHNVCMVSRSDSHEEAMLLGIYKHLVICDDGSWPVAGDDNWG
jgi:hypothetical protein